MRKSTAIKRLKELAKEWPEDLWIFASGGSLHIMQCDKTGSAIITDSGGYDQNYIVDTVDIPSDGGDW